MRTTFSRRAFLKDAALAVIAFPIATRRASNRAIALDIGILEGTDARLDGATLGVEEAKHAAALFGGTVTLTRVVAGAHVPRGLAALLGDGSLEHVRSLLRDPSLGDTLIMNVACAADELRGEGCRRSAFHVAPSDAMRRDAAAAADANAAAKVVAWDASLEKFGADTLNNRFRTRFGRPMTEDAWASWFAVKALWESALRVKRGDAKAIAEHLVQEATQFDGHKGRPLSFRSWDHQLRQPLYVVASQRAIEEPVAKDGESTRDALDRLGVSARDSKCGVAK